MVKMETVKIKNSSIMKLLEAAPSCVPAPADGEKESEQHVTVKLRKKGTCHISIGMNKKDLGIHGWLYQILYVIDTYNNRTVNYFAYLC